MEDLVKGDDAIFAATGVTDGEFFVVFSLKVARMDTQQLTPSLCVQNQEQFALLKVRHSLEKKPHLVMKSVIRSITEYRQISITKSIRSA